jgi:hypothetical protein
MYVTGLLSRNNSILMGSVVLVAIGTIAVVYIPLFPVPFAPTAVL